MSGIVRPVPGVGAVVVEEGRLLMVLRGRGALAGRWAVPGGRPRLGEPMREAARREVEEETGLVVEIGGVLWVGDAIDSADPPQWHYTLVDFEARVIGGILAPGDDAADARWVPLEAVQDLPLTPTMVPLLETLNG